MSHDGDALRREAREVLEALFSIAEAAAAVDDPDDLYGQIHAIVGRLMPARSFYIALTDDEMRTIRFPYFADERDTPPGPGARPFGHGLTEYAMRARRPLLADAAVLDDLVRAGEIDLLGQRSLDWMGAPVLVGGQALGVIVVQSYDPDVRYRPDDLEILAFVARMVALVLQRKRSEDVLVETNRSLAALVDNLPGVAFRCSNDPDWTMEYLSSGIRELTGWSATELLTSRGMNHASLIDAQDRQRVRDEVQRALDARRAWTLEYRISTADGTPRWIMERGAGVCEGGRLVALEGFFTDVTERHLAERESARIAWRRREARRAESVGRLAETMAHEMNNILAPALLMADHLASTAVAGREEALIVRAAILRARDQLERLLAVGRRESLALRAVDLRALVTDREAVIRAGLPDETSLTVNLGDVPVPVSADAFWIGEVLDGLVARAREAMPRGGRIAVAVSRDDPRGMAVLSVSDTVSEPAADTARRLYEPFPAGGGLGLSFLHGIVEQHGGDIEVGHAEGGGTVFRVLLPCAGGAPP